MVTKGKVVNVGMALEACGTFVVLRPVMVSLTVSRQVLPHM